MQHFPVLRVPNNVDGLIRFLEVLHFLLAELDIEATCRCASVSKSVSFQEKKVHLPKMSSRLAMLVVPIIGADTPGFAMIHAIALTGLSVSVKKSIQHSLYAVFL